MPLPALSRPLPWKSEDEAVIRVLEDVQANIFKGHGRKRTIHLFLEFDHARAEDIRAAIRQLSGQIKSARQQLMEAEQYRSSNKDGGTVRCLFLTFEGYAALGVAAKAPLDDVFRAGMKARKDVLGDDPSTWEPHFRKTIHAMLLLADNAEKRLDAECESLVASLEAVGVTILHREEGEQRFNDRKQGIEHFGYIDGRSQPLILAEDVAEEKHLNGGSSMWDPAFPPSQFLVTASGRVLGSFFVFRKLEQNVKAFDRAEDDLADALKLKGEARELAGALIVGRFEDGTPVVLRNRDGFGGDPFNNFNYADDRNASKCPLHAHIRKTNPRGTGNEPEWREREHIMLRRGITYGRRDPEMKDRPERGVGLLFMSYQVRIEDQFEFVQAQWANNPEFPPPAGKAPAPGVDPIISSQPARGSRQWPTKWGDTGATTTTPEFHDFVTVKGGEYFFAPAISDLRTL